MARAVVSPRYSPFGNYRGDLGLLVLKKPTSVPPIPIAHRGDDELVLGRDRGLGRRLGADRRLRRKGSDQPHDGGRRRSGTANTAATTPRFRRSSTRPRSSSAPSKRKARRGDALQRGFGGAAPGPGAGWLDRGGRHHQPRVGRVLRRLGKHLHENRPLLGLDRRLDPSLGTGVDDAEAGSGNGPGPEPADPVRTGRDAPDGRNAADGLRTRLRRPRTTRRTSANAKTNRASTAGSSGNTGARPTSAQSRSTWC